MTTYKLQQLHKTSKPTSVSASSRQLSRQSTSETSLAKSGVHFDFSKLPISDPTSTSTFPSVSSASLPRSSPPIMQRKLYLGAVNDQCEHEADKVAALNARGFEASTQIPYKRQPVKEHQRISSMQRSLASNTDPITADAEDGIRQAQGGGIPLPNPVRRSMEKAFNADFRGVRVHTDANADRLNRAITARAFTTGQDIFFRQGEYTATQSSGHSLLAHELTHVVQQNNHVVRSPQKSEFNTHMEQKLSTVPTNQQIGVSHSEVSLSAGQVPAGSVIQPARTKLGRILGTTSTLGLGQFAAYSTFGSQQDRHKITTPTTFLKDKSTKPYRASDISITAQDLERHRSLDEIRKRDTYVLRGRRYDPKDDRKTGPGEGNAVILFSGSGGSNEDQLEPQAEFYSKQGATVFAINYRGFGESRDKNRSGSESDPLLSEQGLIDDAEKIYQYVRKQFASGKIVLHGFSLGGAVAAKITKRLARRGEKLGGLVLHSSIRSTTTAAKGDLGPVAGEIGGKIGKLTAGGFNTKQALESIAEADPNLPIHYMSGTSGVDEEGDLVNDQLRLAITELEKTATGEGQLSNVTSGEASGRHLQTELHLNGNTKDALATLLKKGRERDPNRPFEESAIR